MRPRYRDRTTAPLTLAAVVLLTASLSSCTAPQPSPTEPPTSPETGTSTPSPSPTASPAALVIPDCEQLVPIDSIRQFEGWSEVILIQTMEGTALAGDLPGSLARDAAARAPQNRGCLLGVPQSDAGVGVYTLEIAAPTRDNLIDALRADAGYTESSIDGAPSFAIATEDGLGGTTVSYTFVGDAWLILRGSLIDPETAARVAAPAIAELRASNPGLDDR
ncbi:hypothetical protein [Microbacterium aurum]